jgi:hypothetical protein
MPGLCFAMPAWVTLTWDIARYSVVTVLLWGLGSATLGVLAAAGVFFGLRAIKGYRWGWRHARWFRLATLALTLLALPPLFAIAGALQGTYTVADRILTESDAAHDLYALVGGVGADVVATVYVLGPQLSDAAGDFDLDAVTLGELEGFRSGQWEICVPELATRLAGTSDDVLESVAARAGAEARGRFPALNRGLGSWVLTTSLDRIVVPALKDAAHRKTRGLGVPAVTGALLKGMADAARRSGPPDTIGRRDLSSHLVRRWIVGPLLLRPLRGFILAKQMIVWGAVGLVVLLPVVFFQAAHAIRRAVARGRTPAGPTTSGGTA